jgi:hypothetical protein
MDSVSGDVESYYMWSGHPLIVDRFFQNANCDSPLIVVGIKDLVDLWMSFNWWHETQTSGAASIDGFARRHPNANIIIFTSVENLDRETQQSNVHVVPWGGDWVNQQAGYTTLDPVLDKNFDSDRSFVCLNRHVRPHRLITLSYLLGGGYQDYGVISYLKNPKGNPDVLLDNVSWEFGPDHESIRAQILDGFDLIKTYQGFDNDDYHIYERYGAKQNDNIGNFNNRLRPLYRNSFVEIVTESTFAEPSFAITEKTAHSFFGCNFPIVLGGCGIISHLRELGLDVFDDVVDHSYDLIANPFDRIASAIESNRRLLIDTDHAKQSWIRCESRFESNVAVMRNIYSWYEQRAKTKFAQILGNLSR